MPMPPSEKFSRLMTVAGGQRVTACDFVAAKTGLSKSRVKDAMNKGALWLVRKGERRIRLRKASFVLKTGDAIKLYYDEKILKAEAPQAVCLVDYKHYSLWSKPAGLLTQGTDYGDSGSLLRQVELFFKSTREVYPVHRLDREAEGLILVAHSRRATARLSALFQTRQVVKRYRVEVLGLPAADDAMIDLPLDGKAARSRYRVIFRDSGAGRAVLEVEIETGRLHQIRRRLADIGHPVMGDPRYGTGNRNGEPMRLCACELSWRCPFTEKIEQHRLDE